MRMNDVDIQRDLRGAIAVAYELSRHEHVQNRELVASALREVEGELMRIEAELGGPEREHVAPGGLGRTLVELGWLVDDAGPVVAAQIRTLVGTVRGIAERLAWTGPTCDVPSRPLLGVLPLARVVPQDAHSILDYASAVAFGSTVLFSRTKEARITGAVLQTMMTTGALVSDTRMSAAKLVPIELHEIHDYLWGAAAVAAPFALGYAQKDRAAAAVHVATGALLLVSSLFTDYRGATGKGRRAAA
jgi:hypothetical protein